MASTVLTESGGPISKQYYGTIVASGFSTKSFQFPLIYFFVWIILHDRNFSVCIWQNIWWASHRFFWRKEYHLRDDDRDYFLHISLWDAGESLAAKHVDLLVTQPFVSGFRMASSHQIDVYLVFSEPARQSSIFRFLFFSFLLCFLNKSFPFL